MDDQKLPKTDISSGKEIPIPKCHFQDITEGQVLGWWGWGGRGCMHRGEVPGIQLH